MKGDGELRRDELETQMWAQIGRRGTTVAALLAILAGAGCAGDDGGNSGQSFVVTIVDNVDATNPTGTSLSISFEVSDPGGTPRGGVAVEFFPEGGGEVDPTLAFSDAAGTGTVTWTLGIAPVVNRLIASVEGGETVVDTLARLDTPLVPQPFGDIPAFIAAEMLPGSTEDLAFDGERRLILGIGGGLIAMDADGNASLLPLSGDPIEAPLGIAYDAAGNLWVADSRDGPTLPAAGALLRVSPDGVVSTVLTGVGDEDLVGPNYVAIGPDGRVYLSDPCLGALIRYDPESGVVDADLRFDLAAQGGPNGLAFGLSDHRLFLATESVALLCGRPDVDPTLVDPVAGLFYVDVDEEGFGPLEPIAERMGLFGDGLAFDRQGNLYVIFDTQANLALEESAVWVLPGGRSELVKFLAASDRVFANIAFGHGAFGDETMYLALLAIDAFGLPVRGVERIEVGIAGLPLLR